jgi:hypothetical protein
MNRIWRSRLNTEGLFNGHYVDVRALYVQWYHALPCVLFIGDLDISRAYQLISASQIPEVQEVYQHSWFSHDDQDTLFNTTVLRLQHRRLVELTANYCYVLHTPAQYTWAKNLASALAEFRVIQAPRQVQVMGFARQQEMN